MEWEADTDLAKLAAAADLARQAIGQSLDKPGGWLARARMLFGLGQYPEAAQCARDALAAMPTNAELELLLAQSLNAQDFYEEALPHAAAALTLAPELPTAKDFYLHVLAALGRWDEAALDADVLDRMAPASAQVMKRQVKALGPDGTLALCERQLAADPANTNARFLRAWALARLGRDDEACDAMALDRLVETSELPAPPGYASGEAFRDALAREIRANPTLAADPRNKATRGGLQTRRLRQPNAPAIEALLAQLRDVVDRYERRVVATARDLAAGRPKTARLNAWAVIYGAQGCQKAHRHPGGWLSGVYYVAAPRARGENAYRGPLVVGALDPVDHGIKPPWGTRDIEPVPGRVVLFPSYVPHATEPSGVDGARISVAFDVTPVRES